LLLLRYLDSEHVWREADLAGFQLPFRIPYAFGADGPAGQHRVYVHVLVTAEYCLTLVTQDLGVVGGHNHGERPALAVLHLKLIALSGHNLAFYFSLSPAGNCWALLAATIAIPVSRMAQNPFDDTCIQCCMLISFLLTF
jgi:hypothetical protein